ncbi:MAG: hypothetical protein DHS20C17_11650 [Cyclobacteriaceae bacterium]|nr:MAG: hypothetical protein DHS20C17_11650 [Cyclobacteriaceae bacterium]
MADYPEEQKHYWKTVKPIFDKNCNKACHNADDNKGGLNLNQFDFILSIQKRGDVFLKVIEHIENGTMPPEEKPPLTRMEKDTLLFYIKKYIKDALEKPDPGIITARRLSNREYEYAIQDLTGIFIETDSLLPRDPGGGEGFDNFSGTLYVTPLLMERYFEISELVIHEMYEDQDLWRNHVPSNTFTLFQKIKHWWYSLIYNRNLAHQATLDLAQKAIVSFTTLAYRRYLSAEERTLLLNFFDEVYKSLPESKDQFDLAMQEVLKAVLVSHHFLIRQEADPPFTEPYLVNSFELATRMSSFLWCSIPDVELLEAAYKGDLSNPELVRKQVRRMLEDPKSKRMAESFVSQWLEIDNIIQPEFEKDPDLFPEFSQDLRTAMYGETVEYFYYTLSDSRNFLELLNGNYTFLNESLANHYGLSGIEGDSLRKVVLDIPERGGILGMASVLTTTSLPNRTSPVLRGKWVMEKVLSSPPKPPPPNVPDLEATKEIHDELTLREALVIHRENPSCFGCHQDMDDLGFALENYDAVGRWRANYENSPNPIDVSGSLKSGETFEGALELKEILNTREKQFANGISRKMLGFALGRSVVFKDTKTIETLADLLVEYKFDPVPFIEEIVLSYPFQYKKTDKVVVDHNVGDKVI